MVNQENVQLNSPGTEKPAGTPGYAWVVLTILYLTAVLAGYIFLAAPPLMPVLIDHFKIHLGGAGLMMSLVGFTGLVLSLPTGPLVKKFGIKVVGIIAAASLCVGSLLAAWATSYTVFLVSRGIVGIGFSLLMLLGTTTVGIWFSREQHGLGMGLVSTCVGIGGFLAMSTAPRLERSMGLQFVWWLCAAIAFVMLLAIAIWVRMPPWMNTKTEAAQKSAGIGEGFTNRNMWLLGFAFCCIYFPTMALLTFYVHYLTRVRGYSLQYAGMINSLGLLGMLVGALLGGYVIGKIGHLKLTLTIGALVLCLMVLLPFNITGIMIPIWVVLMDAIGMGFLKVACITAVPGIMVKPQLIAVGMAIYGFGVNLGGMIGPPYLGAIAQWAGWNASAYALVPVILIGVILIRMTKFAE